MRTPLEHLDATVEGIANYYELELTYTLRDALRAAVIIGKRAAADTVDAWAIAELPDSPNGRVTKAAQGKMEALSWAAKMIRKGIKDEREEGGIKMMPATPSWTVD